MKNGILETFGSKPSGLIGTLNGRLMNRFHTLAYRKIIKEYIEDVICRNDENVILDVGCGGGVSVRILSKNPKIDKVFGIDYSEDMVKLSRKYNKNQIKSGIAEIIQADVKELPFKNDHFDIITAFDTVNFWLDNKKAISEIFRTLKPDGSFFIVNAYPKEGTKWHDFVRYKSEKDYRNYLDSNGFADVVTVIKKKTIIVCGKK